MEDKELIKKCQAGEKEAFQELIVKYHPFVYKFLIKVTQNKHEAEDLTQETFLKLIRNIEKFDIECNTKFSTYLITVAKNSYIDYFRKQSKLSFSSIDESFELVDKNYNLENTILDAFEGKAALEKLEELSKEQRIAIKLKYIEGLTLKEIGERLEIEPKTVKSRIHNGIEKLRKMFERED